ncbi:phosphotransferase family protein [Planotetraspora sp. GP83]|uniref:phosphotransferase family protein n=1 Tax=Planotetraspora sp. GP83 TaxID=3156264 RepID=UPI003518F726
MKDVEGTDLAVRLARRLGELYGAPVEVSRLRRLPGGASMETWVLRARPQGGPARDLVLRREPPRDHEKPGTVMAREAAVIAAAARAGVPVAELVDHGVDDAALGSPYLLTAFVEGETLARRILRDAEFDGVRPALARECGRVLARVHSIPPSSLPGLRRRADPLEELAKTWERFGEPSPAIEIALRWLRENRPAPAPDAVVHGDFRNGNLIVHPTGLRAVLDWELAHLGDPLEDLGWLCVKAWRFGSASPVGGFGTREELFAGYAEVAGARPDPAAVRWWEVYGTAGWAVGCRVMAERHLSGQVRSVEPAAVGRRACEQEHDLLLALGVPPPVVPGMAAAEIDAADLYGRPSAAELVEAVAEFLRTEAAPGTEGRVAFLSRVAANVLDVVRRELDMGERQRRENAGRLATLGFAGRTALAEAIRAGTVPIDDARVIAAVRAEVTDRLTVANPRYLSQPADAEGYPGVRSSIVCKESL